MSIAKFNERALLDLGLDRQTVAALRHILTQTGNEVGATPLPKVAQQAAPLEYRAALLADKEATDADVAILSMDVPKSINAGAMVSGRVVGVTSNGTIPGTLNLWLSVDGAKVFTHVFTTPEVIGTDKGFAADFMLCVRTPGSAVAGGVLHLAYNAPTVLPSVNLGAFSMPTAGATFALGMNWTAAQAGNIATAKLAYLSVDKL